MTTSLIFCVTNPQSNPTFGTTRRFHHFTFLSFFLITGVKKVDWTGTHDLLLYISMFPFWHDHSRCYITSLTTLYFSLLHISFCFFSLFYDSFRYIFNSFLYDHKCLTWISTKEIQVRTQIICLKFLTRIRPSQTYIIAT